MRIKDICSGVTDGSHNPPQGLENSDYLMLSSKNVFDDKITFDSPRYLSQIDFEQESKRTRIKSGDVLLTIVGTVGRAAVVGENMPQFTLQRSVAVLHPNVEICDSRYLMYALQANRNHIESRAKGVAQKGIYLKEVADIELQIPLLSEQTHRVKVLDKIAFVIKFHQKQLQKLDELVKARFVELFGNPVLNSMNWQQKNLGDIAFKIGSGATPKGGKESYRNNGISLIRSMNVRNGQFEYKDLAHISDEQAARLENVIVEKNDVLLNITGASVARCCIVPDNILPARVNQHVCIIRCKDDILPEFLNFLLIDNNYQDLLWGIAGSGATREAITKQQIESLQIIVPPKIKQSEFVLFAQQVDKSKVAVQKSLDEAQLLFDSLMQQYFG